MILDNINGAIFDLDGTMLDSLWVWQDVDRRFLGRRGFAVPPDYMQCINHMSAYETALYTIDRFGLVDTPEQLMEEWHELVKDIYRYDVYLKPYVAEFVRELYFRGVRLTIATALDKRLAVECLEHNNVMQYFSGIVSVDDVARGKSFPDVYLKAARDIGVRPSECVVFEDILQGIMGASSGGFLTVGVYDYQSRADEGAMRVMADRYIYDFGELLYDMQRYKCRV